MVLLGFLAGRFAPSVSILARMLLSPAVLSPFRPRGGPLSGRLVVAVSLGAFLACSPSSWGVNGAVNSSLQSFKGADVAPRTMRPTFLPRTTWGDPYATQHLTTEYAESAMPPARGRKTVILGALLILLFLALTEWRIQGEPAKGTTEYNIKQAQDTVAAVLNAPTKDLNEKLEEHGRAFSVRLMIFATAVVCLSVGALEILFSANRRRKHKKQFRILMRAPSMKASSLIMLLVAFVFSWAVYLSWPHLGKSIYL